jgi:hypothetical protein
MKEAGYLERRSIEGTQCDLEQGLKKLKQGQKSDILKV